MDIITLKKELALLGAKTTGSKKQLERRLFTLACSLFLWKEKGLHKTLLVQRPIAPNKDPIPFPNDGIFQPLDMLKGEKVINYSSIDDFFYKNMAKKGREKGRILAMKLFIKYTRVSKKDNMYFIKSICCAEQRKTLDYHLKMIVKKNEILETSCSCPAGAGQSAACKHIGALCFSLEYFSITGKAQEYISCTSEKMIWNKPSGRGVDFMSIYAINNTVRENISTCNIYTDNIINRLINRKIFCSLTNCRKVTNIANCYMKDHTYHSPDIVSNCELPMGNGTYINTVHDSEAGPSTRSDIHDGLTEHADCEESFSSENSFVLKSKEIDHLSEYILQIESVLACVNESYVLNNLTAVTPANECCRKVFYNLENVDNLSIAVKTKSDKKLWQRERQFRITGSRCYSLYTYSKNDWSNKAQKYFWPKSFTNKFVQYGLETEREARICYMKSTNYTVIEAGIIIPKTHSWLGYSPDGIVLKGNKPYKLLEIKCPIIGKEKNSAELITSCDYLQIENFCVVLKKKHLYYAQVQFGMAILNLTECDFIVYSKYSKSFANIIVPFDEAFGNRLLKKLQDIYIFKMLHEICLYDQEQ